MNPLDRQAFQERYTKRLLEFGHDPRTLGWDKGKQSDRFEALTQLLPIPRLGSVLDVGCGFGDLIPFLRQRGFAGRYTGIDFVPGLIDVGRSVHPSDEFIGADFASFSFDQTYDLVTASGIFNARLNGEAQDDSIRSTLAKMFSLANVAVSADFLSAQADMRRPDLSYAAPDEILRFGQSLTRRAALLHHYMPFEFAVYLFKDQRFDNRTLFFPLFGDE